MIEPGKILIEDYSYSLPEEKIALHPLPERDASRLLIYQDEKLSEDIYKNLAQHLPAGSLLVFNNTKVLNARLKFKKSTGGSIEVFCLEPYEKITELSHNMAKTGAVVWKCFVGGASKWKEESVTKEITISEETLLLSAKLLGKEGEVYLVEFSWLPATYTFAEVIEAAGEIPLPPYIKRRSLITDSERYQTIYAMHQGSVAAPTAGLHFTEHIFNDLTQKGIRKEYITLHVGAGTFKPVKSTTMGEHTMHAEWIEVSTIAIKNIIEYAGRIIAVGTTSTRTMETLYWLGIKALVQPGIDKLELGQWEVYESPLRDIAVETTVALNALIKWIENTGKNSIFTQTQLLITPGYKFKVVNALVTNFHQPKSTLLLLVAAAVKGQWRFIYDYALQNDFRFLSYGDGNLLFIDQG